MHLWLSIFVCSPTAFMWFYATNHAFPSFELRSIYIYIYNGTTHPYCYKIKAPGFAHLQRVKFCVILWFNKFICLGNLLLLYKQSFTMIATLERREGASLWGRFYDWVTNIENHLYIEWFSVLMIPTLLTATNPILRLQPLFLFPFLQS